MKFNLIMIISLTSRTSYIADSNAFELAIGINWTPLTFKWQIWSLYVRTTKILLTIMEKW